MKIYLPNVKIVDANSPHNGRQAAIIIENGCIVSIEEPSAEKVKCDLCLDHKNLHISASWVDSSVSYRDPGSEWQESLGSLYNTAKAGGIGHIIGFPNTKPIVQTKESLSYFKNFSDAKVSTFHNLAALSIDCEGKDFTDWLDLHVNGAKGFTEGEVSVKNPDLFLKSLQYLAPLNSVLVQKPIDSYLSMFGQMHEGIQSTLLGLKGISSTAEEIVIERDLSLLRYLNIESQKPVLHFTGISTQRSVNLIRAAKNEGLAISCDVSAHHLIFKDTDLYDFDSNLKVLPPYRAESDQKALIEGLKDGTIDAIASHHSPWDAEHKELEFDLSEFGNIGMQTLFAVLNTHTNLSTELIISKITDKVRHIYNLEPVSIIKGQKADFTVFDPGLENVYDLNNNMSNCKNSPFLNQKLKGKALGIIKGNSFES
jgi:dihydroorotase